MLTEAERKTLASVTEAIRASYKVPCTGCGYCMPCPKNINIPACFAAYNNSYALGFVAGATSYITSTNMTNTDGNRSPSACVRCGKCEQSCPQHIAIRSSLESVRKRMEPFWLKGAVRVVMKIMK